MEVVLPSPSPAWWGWKLFQASGKEKESVLFVFGRHLIFFLVLENDIQLCMYVGVFFNHVLLGDSK